MQHYTTIEQSKHLLELGLSPETADIFIPCYGNNDYSENRPYFRNTVIKPDKDDFPCWSIGALLELLPIGSTIEKVPGGYNCYPVFNKPYQENTPIEAAYKALCCLLVHKSHKLIKLYEKERERTAPKRPLCKIAT